MPSDRPSQAEIEAAAKVLAVIEWNQDVADYGWKHEPSVKEPFLRRAEAALSAAATAHPDCREVVAELVAALDAFCRMPDAGLTADDPRFEWWYETAEVRKRAREAAKRFERALGEGSGEESQ